MPRRPNDVRDQICLTIFCKNSRDRGVGGVPKFGWADAVTKKITMKGMFIIIAFFGQYKLYYFFTSSPCKTFMRTVFLRSGSEALATMNIIGYANAKSMYIAAMAT